MLLRRTLIHGALATCASIASACATTGHDSYAAQTRRYQELERESRDARAADERALAGPLLERDALVRAVLHRNPSVESARQAWRAALARYRQAGAFEDPMLDLSLAPLSIPAPDAPVGFEVALRQRIPLGGKLSAQSALAAAEAEVAATDLEHARLELATSANALYDDYFAAVRSLEVQTQHRALIETLKESAAAAFAAGRGMPQESLRAEAELARLDYQSSVYETERDVAVAQLNALLHRDPAAPLPPPPPLLPPRDVEPPAAELGGAIASRPEIAEARARTRVASARAQVADSDYYPDLALMASYNSMWDMPEHRLMAGVELSIPLERARRAAASDEASALRASAESDVQSMTDAARTEIAVATRRIAQARRAVQLYEQQLLPVARARIDAARDAFASGRSSIAEVVDAEHELRSAELERVLAHVEASRRSTELERALGRTPGLVGKEHTP